jgi:MFS family permease
MQSRRDKGSFINKRLLLLAAVGFLLLTFAAPASQFQNDFLREHRGYSASGITTYWLLTSTPAGIAIFLAGRFADTHGRKKIATSGVLGGTVFIVLSYYFSGVLMWTSHLFGAVLGSLTVALGVYGPELFSTNQRARSNGIIVAFSVLGSATGLLLVGYMTDLFDNYGHAFAIVSAGPLLAAILIISKFPETARVELEDLNPGDIRPEISES